MLDKLTKFVIDRSVWYRGQDGASLLMEDGKMCCLGIAGRACGIPDDVLLEVGEPGEMASEGNPKEAKAYFDKLPFLGELVVDIDIVNEYCANNNLHHFYGEEEDDDLFQRIPEDDQLGVMMAEQTSDCEELMQINDSREISEVEREQQIADIFAKHGVTVTFIGE